MIGSPRRPRPRSRPLHSDQALRDLIAYIARSLVDHPDAVEVTQRTGPRATILQLQVHPDDAGKVIGRGGRIAKAIRTLLSVPANRQRRRAILEIV